MANLALTASAVLKSANGQINLNDTAGAAIAAGDVIYRDGSGLMKLADADAATELQNVTGIALNNAAIGQPVAYVTVDPDLVLGNVLTIGTVYVLSATPGKICPSTDLTSDMVSIVLGIAKTATTLNFSPLKGGIVPE